MVADPSKELSNSPSISIAPYWRWIAAILGLFLLVSPFFQAYIAVKPNLIMLEFIPFSVYVDTMLPLVFLGNASIIAGIAMFLGGVLLIFRKRWGYVLSIAACAFSVVSLLETVGVFTWILSQSSQSTMALYAEEAYEWMGLFPVFFTGLILAALVVLNLKPMRSLLSVRKREVWVAMGIALLLVVDMNVTLLWSVSGGGNP